MAENLTSHKVRALAYNHGVAELVAAAAGLVAARLILVGNPNGAVAAIDEAVAQYRVAILEAIDAAADAPPQDAR